MFIILIFFPIMLGASWIIKNISLNNKYGPFSRIIWTLRFIAVFIHELSHLIMALIVGIRPKSFSVKLKSEKTHQVNPSGAVGWEGHNCTFLQAALISLAPVIFSTWLFFWSLSVAFTSGLNPFVRIVALILSGLLFLGATPSKQDFWIIGYWFKKNPKYSLYQIFLLLLSMFFVWGIVTYYNVALPLDIVYYILVGIGYYVLKYSFRGIGWLLFKITTMRNIGRSHSGRIRYNRFIGRRFKPSKPSKLGKRKAPW